MNCIIYIPLLDEGTPTLRRTFGEFVADGIYKVLSDADYDPEDENWEFPPGSVVKCRKGEWKDAEILIAFEVVRSVT